MQRACGYLGTSELIFQPFFEHVPDPSSEAMKFYDDLGTIQQTIQSSEQSLRNGRLDINTLR
jgi:hypothetical protein